VTYRLGVHTTSDDPTKYRSTEEVQAWERKDPLTRFGAYLQKRNLLEAGLEEAVDAEIARAVSAFEATGAADPLAMFDHAYATRTAPLEAQRAEMQARLAPAPDGGPEPVAPAPPASGAGDASRTEATEAQSPPMRGQRRPWRS
jgi:hypothetical protein